MKKFYLMVVLGDVEPELRGPWGREEDRDEEARRYRREDDEDLKDGIYWLDQEADGTMTTGAYSGRFFDEEEEEDV